MRRIFWISAGCTATALGMLGAVLPLLPTTPFILLAAFCFMQGSERLHRWLVTHRMFGPLIHDWQEAGAISARAKTLAVATMIATLALSAAFGLALWVLAIQAVVLASAALFVLTRPTA
ncbi:YbaN family protein [Pelagibacterium halotolerans]|uniref:YbaN family protein n=1 Tax=Pelagibacterium halotolerans TaxID=531813 RepID=UPI00384B9E9D